MPVDAKTLKKSRLYSEELGISLRKSTDPELFKWFLASALYGARISETIAANTYKSFERHNLLKPVDIVNAGWGYLVDPIMREGGYVRYDGKTSDEILRNCGRLLEEYGGSLKKLHERAEDEKDLEEMLEAFHGWGPVTANIFLRELRPFWRKADPEPLPVVKELAKKHGIELGRYTRKSMAFVRMEAGLIRHREEL